MEDDNNALTEGFKEEEKELHERHKLEEKKLHEKHRLEEEKLKKKFKKEEASVHKEHKKEEEDLHEEHKEELHESHKPHHRKHVKYDYSKLVSWGIAVIVLIVIIFIGKSMFAPDPAFGGDSQDASEEQFKAEVTEALATNITEISEYADDIAEDIADIDSSLNRINNIIDGGKK